MLSPAARLRQVSQQLWRLDVGADQNTLTQLNPFSLQPISQFSTTVMDKGESPAAALEQVGQQLRRLDVGVDRNTLRRQHRPRVHGPHRICYTDARLLVPCLRR